MMEVGASSVGPMKTNIDPRLQVDEPVAGLVEELIEVPVDPSESSHMLKIGKNLYGKLTNQLVSFLKNNLDVFAGTHSDMVEDMSRHHIPQVEYYPQAKLER